MKPSSFPLASLLALTLAIGLALRVFSQYHGFEKAVDASRVSSEGYDQKFIDLVNHLEDVLARRASFAYPGGKDPMTGRRREVAAPASQPAPRRFAAAKAKAKTAKPEPAPPAPEVQPEDKVKLTAIIADDYGQHTAIVMNGERSLSVDVGDLVGNRKVVRITGKDITMEDDSAVYGYDLAGNRSYQRK